MNRCGWISRLQRMSDSLRCTDYELCTDFSKNTACWLVPYMTLAAAALGKLRSVSATYGRTGAPVAARIIIP